MELAWQPLFYCLTFSWARNMIQLQISSVTQQKYNPFNLGTLGFIIPTLAYFALDFEAKTYFWVVALLCFIIFMEFVISVSRQAA